MSSTNKPVLKIDWATHEAAKFACVNWHYSKTVPVGKLVKIGVWENDKFIGVVIFSPGAAGVGRIGPSLGMPTTAVAELQRVALTSHQSPVSRIIKIAMLFLKNSNPGLRLLVSYADLTQGHHGGIYQATNWVYVGRSSATPDWYNKAGKKVHDRNVTVTGYSKHLGKYSKGEKIADCVKVPREGKHKYLMPLDKDMSAKIAPLAKPYPKRVKQAMTGNQPEQRRRDTDPPAPLHAENQPFAEVTE
jgi:hypothetical protein